MAPYTTRRPLNARAIALRIKGVAMKRSREMAASKAAPLKKANAAPLMKANAATRGATSKKTKTASTASTAASPKKRTSRRRNVTESDKGTTMSKLSNSCTSEVENLTGGLKLLKRKMVTMSKISTGVIRGQRYVVQINEKGEPFGKYAGKMQSFIGVQARTKIPIHIPDWRDVDEDEKQKIWESVQEAFDVPKQLRKTVFESAGTKWRNFKSTLTRKYIMPYMDRLDLLEFPPDDFRFITKDVWQEFVTDRLSLGFQELRNEQVQKRKRNKYNHRLSRKGYRGMRAEMAATLSPQELEELGRYVYWIKARQDKDGKFLDVVVEEAVERIVNLQKMEAEGKFKSQGSNDVLTAALGTAENKGRVRGIGGYVRPHTYFHEPQPRRGRKKKSDEDRERELAIERAKWEEEIKKKHSEELAQAEARWEQKFATLEARLESKLMSSESPRVVTPVVDVGSKQGSCSRQVERCKISNGEAVKKRLVLGADGNCRHGKEDSVEELGPADDKEPVQPADGILGLTVEAVIAPQTATNAEGVQKGSLDCKLAVDTVENIVAFGRVVDGDIDPNKQTIHGVPLGAGNVRVSVIVPVVGNAKLPYPINDEIMTVKDATGSIVAWPRNLVIDGAAVDDVQEKPKRVVTARRRKKDQAPPASLDNEDLEHLPPDLPRQLLTLCKWANNGLRGGASILTNFPKELFGHPTKAVIFRKDVYAMAQMEEQTGSAIIFYISYLYEVLKKSQMTDMIGFVDPNDTGALGCGTPTDRSRKLLDRFNSGTNAQIYLVPHNSGSHWTLSVVDPHQKNVYWMDPLKRRLPGNSDWRDVVDNGIKFFYAQKLKKTSRVSIEWIPLQGIPEQKDGKTCALWVMRYMKDIIEDKDLDFATTWGTKRNLRYTPEEINEVRAEWARQVLMFKV